MQAVSYMIKQLLIMMLIMSPIHIWFAISFIRPSLIAGLDCGLDRWTGLLDWITGSNQTASKSDDACVVHCTASKAEV